MRRALDLDPDVPIVMCDARSRESCKDVLISLVEHVMTKPRGRAVGRHVAVASVSPSE